MKSKAIIFLLISSLLTACGYELPKTPNSADNSANSAATVNKNSTNQSNAAINADQTNKNNGAANFKTANGGDAKEPKLLLDASGETATFPCNGREVEVDESVTASNYTLTGECKKLTVKGVSVTVNVEKVGEIAVTGISNKVVYGEGIGGKKPKITKSGPSVFVETKVESEKRKAAEQIK